MEDFIVKWWGFLAFVIAGIFGWAMGVERNRWKIDDLKEGFLELKAEVDTIKKNSVSENVAVGQLLAIMERIESRMDRIEQKLDGKADK
jgi:hypothetical protein